MVASNFEICLSLTLREEGGYSNDAHDPGGATLNGITQYDWDVYCIKHGLPQSHVLNMKPAQRDEIYRKNYWDVMGCDDLPDGIDLLAFDTAVLEGSGESSTILRHADGDIDDFCNMRLMRLRGKGNSRWFFAGWKSRVEFMRQQAKEIASGEEIWTTTYIQETLNKLGASPPLVVDGIEGPATRYAIKAFQVAHGLTPNGLVDHPTIVKLNEQLP
jgi:lysozyme family protein